jgi:hypothetical protein
MPWVTHLHALAVCLHSFIYKVIFNRKGFLQKKEILYYIISMAFIIFAVSMREVGIAIENISARWANLSLSLSGLAPPENENSRRVEARSLRSFVQNSGNTRAELFIRPSLPLGPSPALRQSSQSGRYKRNQTEGTAPSPNSAGNRRLSLQVSQTRFLSLPLASSVSPSPQGLCLYGADIPAYNNVHSRVHNSFFCHFMRPFCVSLCHSP